jgi:hypothetical protein
MKKKLAPSNKVVKKAIKINNKKKKIKVTAKSITEKDKSHEQWYADAKHQTLDTLPAFLDNLANNYIHDYGTICHAMAAAALGATEAIDKSPSGGITGFQAGAVMWEFIRQWKQVDGPMRLVNFDSMLYPQYQGDFEKTMSQETLDWLKKQAEKLIQENNTSSNNLKASSTVVEHWKFIASGGIPFGYTIKK